ncbi:alginate export family protein [Kaistella sp. 97-N-M2]|uniref:alginate export family protein n=1 Tax=Kaistella sp. 97-N-M2 TaxID=2908645 RepID=UPI001F471499|nr:alginate export family protein [Kaistella sp. 97-N-M2]UJF30091.1 alginate export family protein [Kaistella sp. 97-N-M2]
MKKQLITFLGLLFFSVSAHAQIDSLKVNLDFRTRAELDNGYKTLIPENKKPETNVSSRARLGIDYYWQNLELFMSLQDARVWGEVSSTNQRSGSLNVNEAWAKYDFTEKTAVKIGRQILSYDDERLLGALDWQMQGRSFDGAKAIFRFSPQSKLETVVTYNNDDIEANDFPDQEFYSVVDSGERTKSMQILHYQYRWPKAGLSFIGLNNVVQNLNGTHYDMLTVGFNGKQYYGNIGFFGSAYWQTGKNTLAQSKNAYQFSANVDFILNQSVNFVAGTEWLSGTDAHEDVSQNNSFSPLYGTNHKFNGFMDYFFVGNHFNSVGLKDFYVKSNFRFNPKASLTLNLHAFASNANSGYDVANNKKYARYLGTEGDVVFTYKVANVFNMQLGHSQMFAAEGMKQLKNVPDPSSIQSWTWLGLNFMARFKVK